MKASRFLVVTCLSMAALAMSGCGKDLKSYAKVASKALGIPVELKTDDSDVCARRQLDRVVDEYGNLSSDEQDAVKGFARHYKSIVINASTTTARVSGQITVLQLLTSNPYGGPGVASAKTIADHRQTDGTAPKTQVAKADSLAVTTQNAFDNSTTTTYYTYDSGIYTLVTNDGDVLQQAISNGLVHSAGTEASPLVSCGELVGLRDLL